MGAKKPNPLFGYLGHFGNVNVKAKGHNTIKKDDEPKAKQKTKVEPLYLKKPDFTVKEQKKLLEKFEKRIFGPRGGPHNPKLKDLEPGKDDLREDLRKHFKQFFSG